jgi:hypothetical protein
MLLSSAALSTNRPPATASFGFPEFSFRTPVSAATTFSYAAPTTVAPAAAPVAAAGNRYNFGRFFFPAASQQYFGQQQPQYRAIVDYNIRELQPHTLKVHQQHEQQLRVLQKQQQQQLRPQPQFRQHYQQQLRPKSLLKQQQQQRQLEPYHHWQSRDLSSLVTHCFANQVAIKVPLWKFFTMLCIMHIKAGQYIYMRLMMVKEYNDRLPT